MKKLLATIGLSVTLAFGVFAGAGIAGNGHGGGGKGKDSGSAQHVTICHATGTPDNAGNGYVQISPSASGVYNGHYSQHQADIIPPFKYQDNTYSLNWDSQHIAIWKNGCKPVNSTTTSKTTTTSTTSSTPTTTVQSTVTQPTTATVTVKQTTTVQSKPKVVVKKQVVVKRSVKKVYLPSPPKQVKVKPHGFPYTP